MCPEISANIFKKVQWLCQYWWLTLFRRTCNVIYQHSNKARIFCSSLSFQQAPVDIRTSNRSRVTAYFLLLQRMRGARKSKPKKWEDCWTIRSIGSVKAGRHLWTKLFANGLHTICVYMWMRLRTCAVPSAYSSCTIHHESNIVSFLREH